MCKVEKPFVPSLVIFGRRNLSRKSETSWKLRGKSDAGNYPAGHRKRDKNPRKFTTFMVTVWCSMFVSRRNLSKFCWDHVWISLCPRLHVQSLIGRAVTRILMFTTGVPQTPNVCRDVQLPLSGWPVFFSLLGILTPFISYYLWNYYLFF